MLFGCQRRGLADYCLFSSGKGMASHQLDIPYTAPYGLYDKGGNPALYRGDPLPEPGRHSGGLSYWRGLCHLPS